jgi:hypothetical protein
MIAYLVALMRSSPSSTTFPSLRRYRRLFPPVLEVLEHFESAGLHSCEHVHEASLDAHRLRVMHEHVQALRPVLLQRLLTSIAVFRKV